MAYLNGSYTNHVLVESIRPNYELASQVFYMLLQLPMQLDYGAPRYALIPPLLS